MYYSTCGVPPIIDDPRIRFFKGWFEDTLPTYQAPKANVVILNMDADLYSSTIFVLRTLRHLTALEVREQRLGVAHSRLQLTLQPYGMVGERARLASDGLFQPEGLDLVGRCAGGGWSLQDGDPGCGMEVGPLGRILAADGAIHDLHAGVLARIAVGLSLEMVGPFSGPFLRCVRHAS